MRIAFVAGCLEPGYDGVGDYTRTLAAECARLGHEVCLLSLAERTVGATDTANRMPVLRLSRDDWHADGGRRARAWLDAFAPDWASLQFVPYAFDSRGFFRRSIGPLAHILGGARWRHIFFHELWIGSQRGASPKACVCGWWQRRAVAALLQSLAPAAVHTSTSYYRAALVTLRQPATRLPVFGNVPRGASSGDVAWPGVPADAMVCGHYGTLHPGWQPDAFLADFAALAAERHRPAALVAVGSLGYGGSLFEAIATKWRGRVTCVALGRQEVEDLARSFARFDFAVTSVAWNILGKSSSAAALREHGLRVIVTEAGKAPNFPAPALDDAAEDEGFMPYFRDRSALRTALEKTAPRAGAAAAAGKLLADLHAAR